MSFMRSMIGIFQNDGRHDEKKEFEQTAEYCENCRKVLPLDSTEYVEECNKWLCKKCKKTMLKGRNI